MSGTNGYQSTKLNKNRDVRKRSGIKTDLTDMQHPGAAEQHSRTASSDAVQRQRSRTVSPDVTQRHRNRTGASDVGRRQNTDGMRTEAESTHRCRETADGHGNVIAEDGEKCCSCRSHFFLFQLRS